MSLCVQDPGLVGMSPAASLCIAEGVELESTIMEEKEEKDSLDKATVGPLPRWETLDSVDPDQNWWSALPKPVPWFRRGDASRGLARTRKLREELQRLVARQERKK
jgi:hypothetical protein